jgi:hypothetical protein
MERLDMMRDCPEGFEEELKSIIDYLEGQFVDIRDALNIRGLSDIGEIERAYDVARDMCDRLY